MTRRIVPLAVIATFLLTTQPALAAAGDLDTSFGNFVSVGSTASQVPGVAIYDSGGLDGANAMTLASGDRPVVAGTLQTGVWILVMFTSSGDNIDTSFGGGDGVATVDWGMSGSPTGVAIDSLGRILVSGSVTPTPGDSEFAVARLDSSGDLDTTFSGDGLQTVNFNALNDQANEVAIDGSDRPILAGSMTATTGGTRFALARLDAAGELDTTFAGDGTVVSKLSSNDVAFAVTVDGNDKIDVGGWGMNGQRWDVARYTSSGTLDTRFSSDGFQVFRMGSSQLQLTGIAIDSQGRIDVGGYGESSGIRPECAAARFRPNGSFDPDFSGDGIQFIVTSDTVQCKALWVTTNDKLVLAGEIVPGAGGGTDRDVYLARLTTKGKKDPNFGSNGVTTYNRSSVADFVRGVAVQSTGRILVGGEPQDGAGGGLTNIMVIGFLGS